MAHRAEDGSSNGRAEEVGEGGGIMKIIRVFPRKTKATPEDELVRIDCQPGFWDEADEVHISATFTYDIPKAEYLAKLWEVVAPVKVGGPAYDFAGGEFVPGQYLKQGYVITSRGCPNNCWFCSVPKREGRMIKELPITEGWNIADDNLLACSEKHIRAVFEMLKQQDHFAVLSGGLEAARLQSWHVDLIRDLRPKRIYFAYDTPDDYEPLLEAADLLKQGDVKLFPGSHDVLAYVLIGYPGDKIEDANSRLLQTMKAGFMPYAMLYKNESGCTDQAWRRFQRVWARPQIIASRYSELYAV